MRALLGRSLLRCTVMADGPANGGSGKTVVARHVANDTADGGSLQHALRADGRGNGNQGCEQGNNCNLGFHGWLRMVFN